MEQNAEAEGQEKVVEEVVETETVAVETEPTAEVEKTTEVIEEVVVEEPIIKTVPLAALEDERKKRQEMEVELKSIREGVDSLKSQQAPKDIFEAYERDAKGVMRDLNSEISQLATDDAYGNAPKIEQLRDMKDELRRKEFTNLQTTLNQQTTASKVAQTITQAIPDIQTKQVELTKFAIEELGWGAQELQERTNFSQGDSAAREVIRINKMYDKVHAKPQAKLVKAKPTQVEGAGKGLSKNEPNMDNLRLEAQKSGDWTEYMDAKGLL